MKLRGWRADSDPGPDPADRKSTRLNSSHGYTSYAVLCLTKTICVPDRYGREGVGMSAPGSKLCEGSAGSVGQVASSVGVVSPYQVCGSGRPAVVFVHGR